MKSTTTRSSVLSVLSVRHLLLAATAALVVTAAQAAVSLPNIFSSNMVLQRDLPAPIWGTADPGEKITLSFAGQSLSTTADASGKWRVTLAPLATNAEPASLTVSGEKNTLTLDNVLVGEVWLCSGQSNMAWTLARADNGAAEIARSNLPNLRLFNVRRATADTPQPDLDASWNPSSPTSSPDFSAVAYFFGRYLHKKLNVPVGLINSSWGGTRIEPWTAPDGFATSPKLAEINARIAPTLPGSTENTRLTNEALDATASWLASSRQAAANKQLIKPPPAFPKALTPIRSDYKDRPQQAPTALYNAMIAPLTPLALRGAIWYQGEANVTEADLYRVKLHALISSWRNAFHNPELPLHIVQIAPLRRPNGESYTNALPSLWQAQQQFVNEDKYSIIAIINDIGNLADIHPTNKKTVGNRLALSTLAKTYRIQEVQNPYSPTPIIEQIQYAKKSVTVPFANASRLQTRDNRDPDWFEIADADGWHRANAKIDGTSVILTAPDVKNPTAVRYAWAGYAEPNLQNETELQLGAFTAGTPPPRKRILSDVPEAAGYELVYEMDPLENASYEVIYTVNNAEQNKGRKIKRVAYYLELTPQSGRAHWVLASFDAHTQDIAKIGVPTKGSGARFQQYVKNLSVRSTSKNLKTGDFPRGNIEFWDCNYTNTNAAKIPGASDSKHDFGDEMSPNRSPGYGSMQIHNTDAAETVLAYNSWFRGRGCDLGIGSNKGSTGQPDWTFTKSGQNLKSARLQILAQFED